MLTDKVSPVTLPAERDSAISVWDHAQYQQFSLVNLQAAARVSRHISKAVASQGTSGETNLRHQHKTAQFPGRASEGPRRRRAQRKEVTVTSSNLPLACLKWFVLAPLSLQSRP